MLFEKKINPNPFLASTTKAMVTILISTMGIQLIISYVYYRIYAKRCSIPIYCTTKFLVSLKLSWNHLGASANQAISTALTGVSVAPIQKLVSIVVDHGIFPGQIDQ